MAFRGNGEKGKVKRKNREFFFLKPCSKLVAVITWPKKNWVKESMIECFVIK